jgi:replicative DNA helicase
MSGDRPWANMETAQLVEHTTDEIRGLPINKALSIIYDRFLEPSDYRRAYFASVIKEGRPEIPYSEIFEALEYNPGRLKSVIYSLNEYHQILRGDHGQRVFLGYQPLDTLLRGIRPGQVMGIMGRAGVAKTAIAINVIANIFRRSDAHPVLFFSLEMPSAEVVARLYCIDNGETPERLDAYLSKAQGDPRLAAWTRRYRDLVIVDEGGLKIDDLGVIYKESEAYLGKRIPLVLIDYLGLLRGPGPNSYERISNVSRELKNTAKRLSCSVLVLIQTSRQGGTGGDRVTLTMARDSGAIEEAVDFLLGVWRPELSERGGPEGELIMSVLKNRHGPTGESSFYFDKNTLKIQAGYHGESAG